MVKRAGKIGVACAGLALLGYFGYEPVKLAVGLQKRGFLDKVETEKYEATTNSNLRAIYTALQFAHDSDGQFPDGKNWMDAVSKRIKAGNMDDAEAQKKLIDPAFAGQPGKFGYALNDAAAGKYKGDLKDSKLILVFTSQDASRNAHGNPATDVAKPARAGGNYGITLDGTVVKLK